MENQIVSDNEHTVIEGSVSVVDRQEEAELETSETVLDTTEQEPAEVVLDMTDEREQERSELDTKLKQMIDESVHYYLSQMKEIFMTELITHLLDQKRKYEMEDNEFNKLTDDEKKKVNSFIKELTK
jgi:hypothetical protein